ncbi:hypothetical protein, partial [Allobacillus salarius]|uniref:hypothetical protein n=1 Tax=Allobacillus salarius TaxID=1955272 RepID=UPI003CCC6F1D
VFYVRKISVVWFHFLYHFRTRTPVKFMPGYLDGCCLSVYLFGKVILQCSRTMRYALSFPYHRESIFLSSVISA